MNAIADLNEMYQEQGIAVIASEGGAEHELALTSDSFQDPDSRDGVARAFLQNKKAVSALCTLGFWYLTMDYSKGLFSGYVGRTFSLGCPEEKRANQEVLAAKRATFVANLQHDFDTQTGGSTQVSSRGTTLVLRADYISAISPGLSVKMFLANTSTVESLCRIGFRSVEFQGGTHKVWHTLGCPPRKLHVASV